MAVIREWGKAEQLSSLGQLVDHQVASWRLEDSVELVCGSLTDVRGKSVDLVLANIDRQTLLSMAQELAVYGHAAARLVLSGILLDQKVEIVERFAALGLACVKMREQDGWVALELLRPEPCEGAD